MTRESEVVYNYVEEVDPNLTCAICQSALVDPVTTASCKHTFCRDCITRALKHNPSCPIDRSALTVSSLQDTEPLVQLMLDELHVKCEAQGCGKVMQRGLLLAHLRSCAQAIVTCGDDSCGISMARHRMPHHRAYECFHRRMECSRCSIVVTFKEAKDGKHGNCCGSPDGQCSTEKCEYCLEPLTTSAAHHRWTCPSAPVACTHTLRGCTAIVARNELEKHLANCMFETLSGFFAANDARFKAMEKRHDDLVAENETLRSQLWNLRRGMTIPRGLWGEHHPDGINWPSPESQPPSPRSPPPPLPPLPSGPAAIPIPAGPAVEADPEATPTANGLFANPSPFTLAADAIAVTTTTSTSISPSTPGSPPSVTPPVLPLTSAPRLSRRPLSPPPRVTYTDWVLQRLPPPRMYVSEPCAALRASVIHLASGLDAAERRSEVRTMTEILRIQEEVATLRAIVRPMRMQVLADRPSSPHVARFAQAQQQPSISGSIASTTQAPSGGELLTPPLSTSHSLMGHDPASDSEDDEHLASLSIRESVVFSAQDVHPRSSQSSLVATATATPPRMPAREWTGRPCAFPPPSPEPHQNRTNRLSSLGARLGSSLLGIQRDATPRL